MVAAPAAAVSAVRLPTYADIETAAQRLKGQAVETPLIESRDLNARTGGRLFIKPENLQRTGSFKFRGARNKICALLGSAQPPKKRGRLFLRQSRPGRGGRGPDRRHRRHHRDAVGCA